MRYYIVFLGILLMSCKLNRDIVNVTYSTVKTKARISLPIGFEKQIIKRGQDLEYHFVYPDSSMIYITDEEGTPIVNYKNIDNDSDTKLKSFMAFMENDTLTLEGKDKLGRVWKNRKLKEISIGYLNVPESRKVEFNKAMRSLVSKEKEK